MCKQILYSLILLLSLKVLAGCSSNQLRVQSAPDGADVFISNQDRPSTKVGKTPLSLDPNEYPGLYGSSTQITVSKEGFLPQSVLVPNLATLGGQGRVNFTLSETELPKICKVQEEAYNEIARSVAETSGLVQKRRLADAENLIQSLITKYNGVATLYDIQGNIYYLQKNLNQAIIAYKKSNSLAPQNTQTLKIIDRLEQMQGGSFGKGLSQ